MANTRTFKSLGVIASDAVPVTEDFEPVRVPGTAYRRTNLTDAQQVEGEIYDDVPNSAQINQKLYNQSSFTDVLDKSGTMGWSNLVDYTPPAIVLGTDGALNSGNLYVALKISGPTNGPGSIVVDPVSEDQDNQDKFWLLLKNPAQLELDLADQTPGTEGSREVGYNYIDVNGGIDQGVTVKKELDNDLLSIKGIAGFEILASALVAIELTDTDVPPEIPVTGFGGVGSHKNVSGASLIILPVLDGGGGPTNLTQGIRIEFTDPIPTPYSVQVTANIALITEDFNYNRNTIAYGNQLSTSVDVYHREHTGTEVTDFPFFIKFSIVCYRYVP